jgi:type 2 lantibiotic biosynthesis protein LanM
MQGSVLRSGLLPQWLMAGAGKKRAFDISALGIQPPPPERELPGWLGLNSDGMMAGRSSQPCELPTSLPVELGSPQRLTDFIEQLCDGFALQLQEAMRLRALLLQALARFSGQPRRLVARATRLYFTIQRQMLEPASLRSAVAHGLKLEQLSRSFVLASEKPHNWPMFSAELLQMERLDIPFFEHLIDGEELPLPEGLAPIPGFMKASGLSAAQRRLQELDQSEITFQQQLIRGAIAARHLKATPQANGAGALGDAAERQSSSAAAGGAVLDANVYRQEAFRLGEELWNSAIHDRKGRPEWLGMDLGADGESFHFGLIGNSLYSGASGIALVFARLALASSDPATAAEWRQRAWSCFEGLAELAERNSNDQLFRLMRDLPYGISGSGGILLALLLLAQAGIDEAAPLAAQLVQQLRPERLQADEGIDVIGGVTGLIGPLLLLGSEQALELASACGERLLALQLESGGWSLGAGPASQRRPALTGFSHGAAGMAAALARLAQATGQQRFAEAARRAIAFERGVFVEAQGNWPDFRSSSEPNEFMLSWCHGAPGILLSRHVMQACGLADDRMAQEQQIARSSTLAALERMSGALSAEPAAHLCCGVLGLTALLHIDAESPDVALDAGVAAAEASTISRAQSSGGYTFFSVDTGSLNLPGLLTGKAGVALALLEAAEGLQWLPQVLSAGLLDDSAGKPG